MSQSTIADAAKAVTELSDLVGVLARNEKSLYILRDRRKSKRALKKLEDILKIQADFARCNMHVEFNIISLTRMSPQQWDWVSKNEPNSIRAEIDEACDDIATGVAAMREIIDSFDDETLHVTPGLYEDLLKSLRLRDKVYDAVSRASDGLFDQEKVRELAAIFERMVVAAREQRVVIADLIEKKRSALR